MSQQRDEFSKAVQQFQERHDIAVRILNCVLDKAEHYRQDDHRGWANLAFLRVCEVGQTVLLLSRPEHISRDHSSFVSVCRALFEAGMMFLYVSDNSVSEDERRLRELILQLHDHTTCYLLFKDDDDSHVEATAFRAGITDLKAAISANKVFQNLGPDRQKKILDGKEMYVNGIWSAAKQGGIRNFDWMYKFLSSFPHNAPFSFRSGADVGAVDYKFAMVTIALENLQNVLVKGCGRMMEEVYPEIFIAQLSKH
jgi:hypothetical protein